MPPQIHLIRHAEAIHNVTKDFSIRDPGLTELGVLQSKKAGPEYGFVKEGRKISMLLFSFLFRLLSFCGCFGEELRGGGEGMASGIVRV